MLTIKKLSELVHVDEDGNIYNVEWFEEQGGDHPWMVTVKDIYGKTLWSEYGLSTEDLAVVMHLINADLSKANTETRYSVLL